MKRRNQNVTSLVTAAMIAALYVVLSFLSHAFGLASGAIQIRISEALTILPIFTSAAVPGVTIGCLLFNLLSGAAMPDIVFGPIATFLGALISRHIAKRLKGKSFAPFLVPLPPIFANACIIPWVLKTAYGIPDAYWYLFATVGIGETLSCGVFGLILYFALKPFQRILFRDMDVQQRISQKMADLPKN